MTASPRQGVGSNQYTSRPAADPSAPTRSDRRSVAAAVEHPEDIAWGFSTSPGREDQRKMSLETFIVGAITTGALQPGGLHSSPLRLTPEKWTVTFPVRCAHSTFGLFDGQHLMVEAHVDTKDVTRHRRNVRTKSTSERESVIALANSALSNSISNTGVSWAPGPWVTRHSWEATLTTHAHDYDGEEEQHVTLRFYCEPLEGQSR